MSNDHQQNADYSNTNSSYEGAYQQRLEIERLDAQEKAAKKLKREQQKAQEERQAEIERQRRQQKEREAQAEKVRKKQEEEQAKQRKLLAKQQAGIEKKRKALEAESAKARKQASKSQVCQPSRSSSTRSYSSSSKSASNSGCFGFIKKIFAFGALLMGVAFFNAISKSGNSRSDGAGMTTENMWGSDGNSSGQSGKRQSLSERLEQVRQESKRKNLPDGMTLAERIEQAKRESERNKEKLFGPTTAPDGGQRATLEEVEAQLNKSSDKPLKPGAAVPEDKMFKQPAKTSWLDKDLKPLASRKTADPVQEAKRPLSYYESIGKNSSAPVDINKYRIVKAEPVEEDEVPQYKPKTRQELAQMYNDYFEIKQQFQKATGWEKVRLDVQLIKIRSTYSAETGIDIDPQRAERFQR